MAGQGSITAPYAGAARISGAVFVVAGAAVVAGGVISILSGKPAAAHDLAPLSGPGDLIPRLGQMAPILSAAIAAVVAVAVVALMTARRLAPVAASIELLILGLAIDVCVGGATGRIAHSTDGGVMAATVACMMGGTAVMAGGFLALFGRE
jgi:hypothetical protein